MTAPGRLLVVMIWLAPAAALAQATPAPPTEPGPGSAADPEPGSTADPEPESAADPEPAASPTSLVPPGGVPPIPGVREPRPVVAPEPEPEPEPIPLPSYSLELRFGVTFPADYSFDQALAALRYDGLRAAATAVVGVQIPVLDWLWLGGRFGGRGRGWAHPDRDAASLVAGELLATVQVRAWLGRVVELGLMVSGGLGWMQVAMRDATSDQAVGRFGVEAILAFKTGEHFAFGPRVGYDFFEWSGMNAYGHGVDVGGFSLGLALEGRE
ncbi:MAG: hypothetical protein RLP09_11020 [Sandaracinaceae bacterium]